MNASYNPVLLLIIILVAASGCASSAKYPHSLVHENQKIGVCSYLEDQIFASNQLTSLVTLASQNYHDDVQDRISTLPTHKTVLKYFLQSFPARTSAKVVPILDSRIVKTSERKGNVDVLATGRNLSLDYVITLKVSRSLKNTGYHYQEQWRPRMVLAIEMTRVSDGEVLLRDSVDAEGKAFDKYLDSRALDKALELSLSSLASQTVNGISDKIGPPIRKISENEKRTHQKIYDYSHIRLMADKNNCTISGDLKISKTENLVTYQVPCRDITLTYACDDESESSHCWLQ
jgi:hypothetical protein